MKNKNLNKIKYNVLRTGQLSGIYFSLKTLCLSLFGLLTPVLRSLGLCPSVNPLCCKKLHKNRNPLGVHILTKLNLSGLNLHFLFKQTVAGQCCVK